MLPLSLSSPPRCDGNLMITLSNPFQFRSLFIIHRPPQVICQIMFRQLLSRGASVAQRIEHVPNESGDAGSIPVRGISPKRLRQLVWRSLFPIFDGLAVNAASLGTVTSLGFSVEERWRSYQLPM